MTTLFRVLPWLPDAALGHPGHPLWVPGVAVGRIDNPDHYLALYLSDRPGGACAEAFFYKPTWDAAMLRGAPALPGSTAALATYALDESARVCDLDDGPRLVALNLRPSEVVTRERAVTRGWALRIYQEGLWAGIRWWSYHDPKWGSHGIWAVDALRVEKVQPLSVDHPALTEAAEVLNRLLS